MEQAQYRVLERVGSKEELEGVLARPEMKRRKVAKEELLQHQLLIRYNDFKSVPTKEELVVRSRWAEGHAGRAAEDTRRGTGGREDQATRRSVGGAVRCTNAEGAW
jgi:hypothetical protein